MSQTRSRYSLGGIRTGCAHAAVVEVTETNERVAFADGSVHSTGPTGLAATINLARIGGPICRRTVLWPRDRFVTYEPSDEQWAIPLGFARVEWQMLEEGHLVDLGDLFEWGHGYRALVRNVEILQFDPEIRCVARLEMLGQSFTDAMRGRL